MKFSVLIGVKHFIHMIMMTNLALHTIVASLQTAVPHLTKVPTKSNRLSIQKKKIENFQQLKRKRKGRAKIMPLRKRKKIANAKFKILKKERLI